MTNFHIDFRTIPDIDKKITEKEIDGLNQIFQSPEVIEKLKEIEKFRKKRQKAFAMITLGMIVITLVVGYIIGKLAAAATASFFAIVMVGIMFRIGSGDDTFGTIEGLSFLAIFLYGGTYAAYRSKIEIPLKRDIMSKICKKLHETFEYSYDGKYSFNDLQLLLGKKFLKNYNRIDKVEDSVSLKMTHEKKGFILKGFELRTRMITGSGKNRKNVVTNHDYLMKIVFPYARIPLSHDIQVTPDRKYKSKNNPHSSGGLKILGYFGKALLYLMYVFILISFYFAIREIIPLLGQMNELGMKGMSIFVYIMLFCIVVLFFVFLFKGVLGKYFRRTVSKNQVILEDIEFENLFDVYCDDEVDSRMILTPAFMQKMVDLVHKTGNTYDFLFTDNTVYIKRKIHKKYMEVGTSKNIFQNVEGFLDFYIDMREILLLSKEMHFMYLSQTQENIEESLEKEDEPVSFVQAKGFGSILGSTFGKKKVA